MFGGQTNFYRFSAPHRKGSIIGESRGGDLPRPGPVKVAIGSQESLADSPPPYRPLFPQRQRALTEIQISLLCLGKVAGTCSGLAKGEGEPISLFVFANFPLPTTESSHLPSSCCRRWMRGRRRGGKTHHSQQTSLNGKVSRNRVFTFAFEPPFVHRLSF